MGNTPQDDLAARMLALIEEARLQALATAERERQLQIGNEEAKQAELRAQMSIDEVEVRAKLKKFDIDKAGIGASILGHLKKEVDFTKDLSIIESRIAKDNVLRAELGAKIQAQNALGNTIAEDHLRTLLAQHEVSAGVNTNMLAASTKMSLFGSLAPAIGKALGSTGFAIAQMVSNAFFNLAGVVWDVFKSVLGFVWGKLKEIFNLFMGIQKVVDNLSADVGLTVLQTSQLWTNVVGIGQAALKFGVTFEEAVGFMRTFSELTGLNRVFLADQVEKLSAIAKSTGLGAQETGKIYATMELLGYSTETFKEYVDATKISSGGLNLNVTNVLKTVEKLMPAFRALNFRDGVEGLTKIVQKAQSLRFSLDNMQSLAEKVFNPEGAIELAAKFRVLGGGFAQMADPFNLLLKGQTDAAGLMDDMMKSMSGMAVKNKDGLFSIPPVQQAIIREVAEATGESADNIRQGVLQMAKQADIINKLNPSIVNQDDRQMIANLAEMRGDGNYVVKVGAQGILTAVDSLSQSQIDGIRSQQTNEQEAARNRMDIVQKFQNVYQSFLMAFTPFFKRISDILEKPDGIMSTLIIKAGEFAKFLGEKIEGLFANGGIERLFNTLKDVMLGILGALTGDKTITEKIIDTLSVVMEGVFKKLLPIIGEIVSKSGAGGAITGTAGIMGALGGAGVGATTGAGIGFLAGGPLGSAIGGLIGTIVGGVGGYFGAKGLAGSYIPDAPNAPVKDAIVRSDGSVQPFGSGDLAMLIDESSVSKAAMSPSQSMLTQTKTYNKESFIPLNSYGGGGNGTPQNITLNLSGTLEVKGDGGTAYLTSADLKNIGLQHLTHLILNETDRYKNHQSGKKLSSELITPIRST